MVRKMCTGRLVWLATAQNSACDTAMTSDEGTPLPLTSPMQKYSFSSRTKYSYKSPPTSRAGRSMPWTSTSTRAPMSSDDCGSIACCILLATRNSLPSRSCSMSDSCSRNMLRR